MAITAISRDWGVNPAIVRVVTSDNLAAITTNGYLTAQADNIAALNNGAFEWVSTDSVLINYNGGEGFFTRDATNETFVAQATVPGTLPDTLASGDIFVGNAGNIATGVAMSGDATMANTGALTIADGAINNAKVNAAAAIAFSKLAALPSAQILVGSAGNVATAVALSGDATISNAGALTIANAAVTSAKMDPQVIQYAKVAMTAAQWNGMYAAPFQLVAAPGANKAIIVRGIVCAMTFVAAQYANGGAVICQYDSTVHGAGPNACGTSTIAAAAVNGFAASSSAGLVGQVPVAGIANSTFVNKGLYLSNATAAFDTGDGTWNIHVWYEIVTL